MEGQARAKQGIQVLSEIFSLIFKKLSISKIKGQLKKLQNQDTGASFTDQIINQVFIEDDNLGERLKDELLKSQSQDSTNRASKEVSGNLMDIIAEEDEGPDTSFGGEDLTVLMKSGHERIASGNRDNKIDFHNGAKVSGVVPSMMGKLSRLLPKPHKGSIEAKLQPISNVFKDF